MFPNEPSYTNQFACESELEKKSWIEAIRKAQEKAAETMMDKPK